MPTLSSIFTQSLEGIAGLDNLSDVDLTIPAANGEILVYNSTSSTWIAGAGGGGGGGGGDPGQSVMLSLIFR